MKVFTKLCTIITSILLLIVVTMILLAPTGINYEHYDYFVTMFYLTFIALITFAAPAAFAMRNSHWMKEQQLESKLEELEEQRIVYIKAKKKLENAALLLKN